MAKIEVHSKECNNLTEEDLAKVVKYFEAPSKMPWILMGVGVLLMLLGGTLWILCGLASLGLGIWLAVENEKNKVSDKDFDAIQAKAKASLDCVALNKLGLDASDTTRDAVKIVGPRYYRRGGAELIFKRGEDNIVRYSLLNIVILNFTKKHLALYRCALDLQTGNRLNEETEEFFYQDVVAVKTYTGTNTLLSDEETFTVISGESGNTVSITQKTEWETFELRNSGGGTIEIPIEANTLLKHMGGKFEESEIDKIVNSIRAVLRDKK